jgi:flagellar protein FliS
MQSSARDQYLVNEVYTATPEKRQLLLVEAALRLAGRARQSRQQGRDEHALQALLEAQAIVSHMLGVIDHKTGGELAGRVSAVYDFIYRSLVKAGYSREEQGISDAIRILEIERDTWRQLCEKSASDRAVARPAAPHVNFGAPIEQHAERLEDDFLGGFSLEA